MLPHLRFGHQHAQPLDTPRLAMVSAMAVYRGRESQDASLGYPLVCTR
jgi:hypothetical protein